MDDCWTYAGSINQWGYGMLSVRINGKYRTTMAHRLMYEDKYGEIPEGLVLDHLCDNPTCVNPDHLEAVTQKINNDRSPTISTLNGQKTHCSNGHEFTEANTRYYHRPKQWRTCWICISTRLNNKYQQSKKDKEKNYVS